MTVKAENFQPGEFRFVSETNDYAAGEVLGNKGTMEVRLAASSEEIEASQKLRYKVFYQEMSAIPDANMERAGRDMDDFDSICDHLLVIERDLEANHDPDLQLADGSVVGTYRLLRDRVAAANSGFYTADEFDIAPLIEARGSRCRFLELGRSCVLKPIAPSPPWNSCGRESGTM